MHAVRIPDSWIGKNAYERDFYPVATWSLSFSKCIGVNTCFEIKKLDVWQISNACLNDLTFNYPIDE